MLCRYPLHRRDQRQEERAPELCVPCGDHMLSTGDSGLPATQGLLCGARKLGWPSQEMNVKRPLISTPSFPVSFPLFRVWSNVCNNKEKQTSIAASKSCCWSCVWGFVNWKIELNGVFYPRASDHTSHSQCPPFPPEPVLAWNALRG